MSSMRNAATLLLQQASLVAAHEIGEETWRARTMVFAPHPDDEVLGCGGTVFRKTQSGGRVHLIFMTDGSASHASLMPATELARLRRAEAHEAAAILGIGSECITFLDYPDQGLEIHRRHATGRVKELIEAFQPDEVFVPHAADRIPDHVATFRVVTDALRDHPRPVRIFEYPIWLWNTWPWTEAAAATNGGGFLGLVSRLRDIWRLTAGCRTWADAKAVVDIKRKALRAYRSQTQRRNNNPQWPVLGDVSDGEFLSCFDTGSERFRSSWHRP